jgi:hypothetical protein
MADNTALKGVSNVGDSLLSDILEANLIGFFQWATLGVGSFYNVRIPTTGPYGGSQHQLRLSEDPNYIPGQVWEAFRRDWIWETGVEYGTQPIHVSGVYINGTFYPVSTTGAFAHIIDYPNGRVVFQAPINAASVVTCEYSYRYHNWSTADVPWWREIQIASMRVDDFQFLQTGSGAWSQLSQSRVQLPAVVIEAIPQVTGFGKQMGGLLRTTRQNVKFHVLAEDRPNMKWLHDAITYQVEKTILGFDKNAVLTANRFPLGADGSPQASGMMYPDLVKNFFWKRITFQDTRSSQQPAPKGLYYALVNCTMETDTPS